MERDAPDPTRMSFWEHLDELRRRFKFTFVLVLLLFVVFLTFGIGEVTVGSVRIPMLLPALGPTTNNVAAQFFLAMKGYLVPQEVGGMPLNFSYNQPWDAYVVMFKVSFFLALMFASPSIVYEVAEFLGPALRPSERRLLFRIALPVVILFVAGVTLCLVVVLPFTFRLLFSQQNLMGADLLVLWGDNFIDFVLLFSLAFGIAFQLPVLMYGLAALGIVSSRFWMRHWRIAVIAIFFFGALITPDGSGITMMFVALPMVALYSVGYACARRTETMRSRGAKSS